MNRNRPVELINFLKPLKTPTPEFCDYFGVKTSLMKKYQILNRLFQRPESQIKKSKLCQNSKWELKKNNSLQNKLETEDLIGQIALDGGRKDPSPPDELTEKYLNLLRDRFM